MTEQQEHLSNLLQQRNNLESQLTQNKELFFKVQGAIEYLTQIGVTLPQPEEPVDKLEEETLEEEVLEEETTEDS